VAEQFRLSIERGYETESRAVIRFDIHVHFENDAPPPLAKAIGQTLATLICFGTDEETLQEIATNLQENQARRQCEADNVARLLIGEEERRE
jgi:7-keto-8-aminopelargonate synthetase-like enzyme